MRFFLVFFLPLLFSHSLTEDTEERKSNMVVKILNTVLEKIIPEVTSKNVTIPLVDLKNNGKLENVVVSVPKMTKWTDGVGSFGFQLRTNVSEIRIAGYYDVKDLDVPGLFPFFGKGNFLIVVESVNLKMKVTAMKNFEEEKFDFDLPVFDVQVLETKVKFDNLMGDPNVSDFLNELIGNVIPKLVEASLPSLQPLVKLLIDVYGNGVVKCIEEELNDLENCIKNLFGGVEEDVVQRLEVPPTWRTFLQHFANTMKSVSEDQVQERKQSDI